MKRDRSNTMYPNPNNSHSGISRRKAIQTIGLGAATTIFTACALNNQQATSQTGQSNANQSSEMITKEIPRTKERVPAIG